MRSVKVSVNGRLRRSVNRFWASFFILFFMGQNSKRLKKNQNNFKAFNLYAIMLEA
jgi:hypothetical protein